MSEQLTPHVRNDTHASSIDEFYVSRINWLITIGRSDLIDEIADDCERRRTTPRLPHSADGLPPKPVETGTRLAVARLSRAPRPVFRHLPETQSIRG